MPHPILVIGNASMDMIFHIPHFPKEGETLRDPKGGVAYQPGGMGGGCAVSIAKLGGKVTFCTSLGADVNGQRLHSLYGSLGIDTSRMSIAPGIPTDTSLIMQDSAGDVRRLLYPGATGAISQGGVEAAFQPKPAIVLVQCDLDKEVVFAAIRRAKEKGVPVVLFSCPTDKDFPLEELSGVEIACFNEVEIEALTGIKPTGENSALTALLELSKKLAATYYVIKMGNRGCFLFDGVHRQMISPYLIKVIDPNGGGEAFVGAMAHEYIRTGKDITAACRFANAAAAITLMRPGSVDAFAKEEEVAAFVAHNGLR